ncbi:hypothetical protein MBLNU459_g7681t2 [Dothideomycetes sp. NU459]
MNVDDCSDGPFAVPELWRKSAYTLDHAPEQSLFRDVDCGLFSEDVITSGFDSKLAVDFSLPDLDSFEYGRLKDISPPETNVADTSSAHASSEKDDGLDDIWQFLSPQSIPTLRTWEGFLDDGNQEPGAAYLSEAGPAAYNALLDEQGDEHSTLLQSAFFLKCLGLLGLGRSSALFQWSIKSGTFEQTLGHAHYVGCSTPCTSSIVQRLSRTGTYFARLRAFIDTAYAAKLPLSARVALARCIQVILEALDQELTRHLSDVKTPLQLLSCLHVPGQILHDLAKLVEATNTAESDLDFISKTHRRVQQLSEACTPYHTVYSEILDRVSRPWLHSVSTTIGLASSELGCLPTVDLDGKEAEILATFVAPKDGQLISEVSAGLNALRESLPAHPLLNPISWGLTRIDLHEPALTNMDTILSKARQHESDLMDAIKRYSEGPSPSDTCQKSGSTHSTPEQEQLTWQDDATRQNYFAEVGRKFSQPPGESLPTLEPSSEELRHMVMAAVQKVNTFATQLADTSVLTTDLNPLRQLRPLLSAQARIVSGATMRLLFRDCRLRKHLTLQHSFHLFGNGVFLQRLTSALFSSDMSSAERGPYKVPASTTVGLRLDSRDRWPPASSELRLSLMGILSESYNERSLPARATMQDSRLGSSPDLPGGLSFAIREMEDAEIEKILDPHSIFALDFLRLQYSAPAPLDIIITPSSLQKYDDMFRSLLRLVRMVHVTTDLKISSRHSPLSTLEKPFKAFAYEAYHIIASLTSYVFNVGVSIPWRKFQLQLDGLESDLLAEDRDGRYGSRVKLGVQGLCDAHERMLDSMRTRLLLRRRQDKARQAMEAIFCNILAVQKALHAGGDDEQNFWEGSLEAMKIEVQKLLDALHRSGTVANTRRAAGQDRDDTDAFEMLRLQLDMNGYYGSAEDVSLA